MDAWVVRLKMASLTALVSPPGVPHYGPAVLVHCQQQHSLARLGASLIRRQADHGAFPM